MDLETKIKLVRHLMIDKGLETQAKLGEAIGWHEATVSAILNFSKQDNKVNELIDFLKKR